MIVASPFFRHSILRLVQLPPAAMVVQAVPIVLATVSALLVSSLIVAESPPVFFQVTVYVSPTLPVGASPLRMTFESTLSVLGLLIL